MGQHDTTTEYGLILAGGLALGAYQQGALEVLLAEERLTLRAIAGTSVGAFNGAIVAGNRPERQLERLRSFWSQCALDPLLANWAFPAGAWTPGRLGKPFDWLATIESRLAGSPGLFRLRTPLEPHPSGVPSLYETGPAVATLRAHIDFDLLNAGPVRFCCATTDTQTGRCVVFDTAAGDRIELDHLLASGGLMPSFAPQPIDGRLLGDGGFTANAPLEPFLASQRRGETLPLYVLVDLFSGEAPAPRTLEVSAGRSVDMNYAGQTLMRLEAIMRERALELRVPGGGDRPGSDLVALAYQPLPHDPGPEKMFDFARRTIEARAERGREDARAALRLVPAELGAAGLRVHHLSPDRD